MDTVRKKRTLRGTVFGGILLAVLVYFTRPCPCCKPHNTILTDTESNSAEADISSKEIFFLKNNDTELEHVESDPSKASMQTPKSMR